MNICRRLTNAGAWTGSRAFAPLYPRRLSSALSGKDDLQVSQMEKDMCVVVDVEDKVLGSMNKKECHLMSNIEKGLLHRAFSVLLFNAKGDFLLTQRSHKKITFPGYFTNACCSHPSSDPEELEEVDFKGIKRAAQRRLHFELGIDPKDLPLNDIQFMTRFLYKAPSDDPIWGEHELDYILVINKQLQIRPNVDELQSWEYLSRKDFTNFLNKAEDGDVKIAHWFYKIAKLFLFNYWDSLGDLRPLYDHKTIHSEKVLFPRVKGAAVQVDSV